MHWEPWALALPAAAARPASYPEEQDVSANACSSKMYRKGSGAAQEDRGAKPPWKHSDLSS